MAAASPRTRLRPTRPQRPRCCHQPRAAARLAREAALLARSPPPLQPLLPPPPHPLQLAPLAPACAARAHCAPCRRSPPRCRQRAAARARRARRRAPTPAPAAAAGGRTPHTPAGRARARRSMTARRPGGSPTAPERATRRSSRRQLSSRAAPPLRATEIITSNATPAGWQENAADGRLCDADRETRHAQRCQLVFVCALVVCVCAKFKFSR